MIALCKCGIDMSEHDDSKHSFDAAGTKYPCDKLMSNDDCPTCGAKSYCPRPAYHDEEGVPCGPLTGEKLWD